MIENINNIHLFYPLLFIFGIIVTFIISRAFKDKLDTNKDIHFKNKDTEITAEILNKFPLVSPDFINKNQKEMAIENNQELHELQKRVDAMDNYVRSVLKYNDSIN